MWSPRPTRSPGERLQFCLLCFLHLISMGLVVSFSSVPFSIVTSLERSSLITLSKLALSSPTWVASKPLTCFAFHCSRCLCVWFLFPLSIRMWVPWMQQPCLFLCLHPVPGACLANSRCPINVSYVVTCVCVLKLPYRKTGWVGKRQSLSRSKKWPKRLQLRNSRPNVQLVILP